MGSGGDDVGVSISGGQFCSLGHQVGGIGGWEKDGLVGGHSGVGVSLSRLGVGDGVVKNSFDAVSCGAG